MKPVLRGRAKCILAHPKVGGVSPTAMKGQLATV